MAKETEVMYVVAGTDEEVLIGDVLTVELEKDFGDGRTLSREVEFKITEETIPDALELGIIEEKERDDDEELIDFDEDDLWDDVEELYEKIGTLEDRVDELEKEVKKLANNALEKINSLIKDVDKEIHKEKRNASSKKK